MNRITERDLIMGYAKRKIRKPGPLVNPRVAKPKRAAAKRPPSRIERGMSAQQADVYLDRLSREESIPVWARVTP